MSEHENKPEVEIIERATNPKQFYVDDEPDYEPKPVVIDENGNPVNNR